ncbi:MAG: hypothetical protein J0I42_07380 [Bosea sp.]|uniref:hypothetical protein n=1 Tax=Bosea sp. (in: a-proteobacteria) TaxID=1871050 RepID=UPI001AC7D2A4|nr:hypothetical protein [Bosea sp. (in: a-proteobacteria)]MBN9451759.1 hypothetical protein [Bosea sp. (in: a-proteobacteria)]
MNSPVNIFAENVQAYREAGFWPRPVVLGQKRPPMKNWQVPDTKVSSEAFRRWLSDYAGMGIGVVMGSLFPDG